MRSIQKQKDILTLLNKDFSSTLFQRFSTKRENSITPHHRALLIWRKKQQPSHFRDIMQQNLTNYSYYKIFAFFLPFIFLPIFSLFWRFLSSFFFIPLFISPFLYLLVLVSVNCYKHYVNKNKTRASWHNICSKGVCAPPFPTLYTTQVFYFFI